MAEENEGKRRGSEPWPPNLRWPTRADMPRGLGAFVDIFIVVFAVMALVATAALMLRFVAAALGFAPEPVPLRDLFLILAGVLGAPFVIWRTWVAQRQADTGERQAETALQANLTARLNEAVQMLGATVTVKVRRRPLFYRCKENAEADWTIRHVWDYEGVPVDLHDWMEVEHGTGNWLPLPEWRALTPERRRETLGDFKDAEEQRPNVEVRLGALYALERISQDSARDHITVMETICAYIGENAPGRDQPPLLPELDDLPDYAAPVPLVRSVARVVTRTDEIQRGIIAIRPPRVEIQTALTILGRRSEERRQLETNGPRHFVIDPREADLRRADMRGLHFERSQLSGGRLEGAQLIGACMEGANLRGARMEGANLWHAGLASADLSGARMAGAYLWDARMEGTDLSEARMEGASLFGARMQGTEFWQARMEGADLHEAWLAGAHLREVRMDRANLWGARMDGAILWDPSVNAISLRKAKLGGAAIKKLELREDFELTDEQLSSVFGDASVTLPPGCSRPDHWPARVLTERAFLSRWAGWRLSRGEPWPPPGRVLADSVEISPLTPTPPGTPVRPEEVERCPPPRSPGPRAGASPPSSPPRTVPFRHAPRRPPETP